MPSKRFYRTQEVSDLLTVPASTLRYWEEAFPMFNPNRLPSGQRRFTQSDVEAAMKIKELLYDRGLRVDAAVEVMNKTYRKSRPHRSRECRTPQQAIILLDEVKAITEDAHALLKIEAVMKFLNTLGDGEKQAD